MEHGQQSVSVNERIDLEAKDRAQIFLKRNFYKGIVPDAISNQNPV